MVGRSENATPGRRTRRGPAQVRGLARSDQIGSVSTVTPCVCTRNVEWLTNVAARSSPATDRGGGG